MWQKLLETKPQQQNGDMSNALGLTFAWLGFLKGKELVSRDKQTKTPSFSQQKQNIK